MAHAERYKHRPVGAGRAWAGLLLGWCLGVLTVEGLMLAKVLLEGTGK